MKPKIHIRLIWVIVKISKFKSILQIGKIDMEEFVLFFTKDPFKIKIPFKIHKNQYLDHNALIFIFSFKLSLLKLFAAPAFTPPR